MSFIPVASLTLFPLNPFWFAARWFKARAGAALRGCIQCSCSAQPSCGSWENYPEPAFLRGPKHSSPAPGGESCQPACISHGSQAGLRCYHLDKPETMHTNGVWGVLTILSHDTSGFFILWSSNVQDSIHNHKDVVFVKLWEHRYFIFWRRQVKVCRSPVTWGSWWTV